MPGTLTSVLKIVFLQKILCKNFILQALFQSAQGSVSIYLTKGSGSGMPKNMRIRIPNTAFMTDENKKSDLLFLISVLCWRSLCLFNEGLILNFLPQNSQASFVG